ncbi:hypothetical protein ACFRIC_29475 [Streptomyces sp. NPDC056738]|uniref:hypothetical protein n=1 Tax=Streptomyces sp. NPDC056738 TaxID=3345933 RepID=UPI0036AAAA2C
MKVRNAKGEVLGQAPVSPHFNPVLLGVDAQSLPMLASIDPYGDTVFNYLQVRRLLVELEQYPLEDSEEFLQRLRELCALALGSPHRFLWFIGD